MDGQEMNNSRAIVVGATGGIGAAIASALSARGGIEVVELSRANGCDLTDEGSIEAAARRCAEAESPISLVFDATGVLHGEGFMPERAWRSLDPEHMAWSYAVNAIGPALLMKHFLPLLPRKGRSVFATLSARVGSIEDNRLGGWHSYRASKAALNQFVRSNAIELARKAPEAICVALHPGTVESGLSEPFAKSGLNVRLPEEAAEDLLNVIDGLSSADSGQLFDYKGERIPF